jgi:hypothetical protein
MSQFCLYYVIVRSARRTAASSKRSVVVKKSTSSILLLDVSFMTDMRSVNKNYLTLYSMTNVAFDTRSTVCKASFNFIFYCVYFEITCIVLHKYYRCSLEIATMEAVTNQQTNHRRFWYNVNRCVYSSNYKVLIFMLTV